MMMIDLMWLVHAYIFIFTLYVYIYIYIYIHDIYTQLFVKAAKKDSNFHCSMPIGFNRSHAAPDE